MTVPPPVDPAAGAARVPVAGGLVITRSLTIPPDELRWRFMASGGPGGQHANTSNTRAEVRFDIAGSPSLGPRQRARLLAAFGPELRIAASDERSQRQNRVLATERLRERLAAALHIDPPRRPTRPSAGAKRRRLDDKRRQSQTKAARTRRFTPDD